MPQIKQNDLWSSSKINSNRKYGESSGAGETEIKYSATWKNQFAVFFQLYTNSLLAFKVRCWTSMQVLMKEWRQISIETTRLTVCLKRKKTTADYYLSAANHCVLCRTHASAVVVGKKNVEWVVQRNVVFKCHCGDRLLSALSQFSMSVLPVALMNWKLVNIIWPTQFSQMNRNPEHSWCVVEAFTHAGLILLFYFIAISVPTVFWHSKLWSNFTCRNRCYVYELESKQIATASWCYK